MAIQNFEQILQGINNSEIRIALELLFGFAGVGNGNTGDAVVKDVIGDLTGNVTGNVEGNVVGTLSGRATRLVSTTAPINAVNAAGVLTWDTFATIGDTILIGTRTYTFVADGTKSADGEIDIGASTAAHSQIEILAAIDGTDTNSAVNTDVVMSAFDASDQCIVTAITPGVDGNDIATVTTVNDATNKFTAATQLLGVDGTIADQGTIILDAGFMYIAKEAATAINKVWKSIPLPQFAGDSVAQQDIASVVDLGETDFESPMVFLDGSAACTVTDWTPTVGVTYIINCIESTNDPVVNLTSGITVDASDNDILTFDTAEDTIVLKCITATRLVIVSNDGVTMSQ
jgi:hypothetical protein